MFFSAGIVAMPMPADFQPITEAVVFAAFAPPDLRRGDASEIAASAIPPQPGAAVAATPKEQPYYSTVEGLPPAGVVASIEITALSDPAVRPLVFTPRTNPPLSAEEVLVSVFAPAEAMSDRGVILARVPSSRPHMRAPVNRGYGTPETSMALAYAPAGSGIEAPFDAVMGGIRVSGDAEAELDLHIPRPRPDPATVLTWLDGRALGQFAPGQHEWVQNPLPASVFEDKQQKCLAQAIYFEARGESEDGQAAVAQVVLNRVRNPAYPGTICGVVYQNQNRRNHCQFSFACDGHPERIRSQSSWETAQRIAREVTEGKIWIAAVGDSTHYHANYVRPGWGRRMNQVDRIGAHIFYRTIFGGWS